MWERRSRVPYTFQALLKRHSQIQLKEDKETQVTSYTDTDIQQTYGYKCFYCDEVILSEAHLKTHKQVYHESFLNEYVWCSM